MENLREPLERAMRAAGDELLQRPEFTVHNKHGNYDFVTDMDVHMQELLRASLTEILPEAAFVSEEDLSEKPAPGQYYWLIDPIDGTTNFVRDLRLSCLAVALCRDGEALVGAVYHPWGNEFFYAELGHGATCNGMPIHVSDNAFADALVSFGQGYGERDATLRRMRPLLEKCYQECVGLRALGVSEVTLCYLAAGRLDGYYEQAVMPWDYGAGGLIVREAGGVCTNWSGGAPSMELGDSLLAGNPATHAALLELAKTL